MCVYMFGYVFLFYRQTFEFIADMAIQNLTSCSQLVCYYGGVCEMNNDKPSCVCRATCAEDAIRTTVSIIILWMRYNLKYNII